MKEFTIETEKDTISSYITLNLATYPEYRLELLKKTKLLLKSDYLVIIRNADFTVPHSDYQRYTPMRKILLFLSDFYSLMNKYPHQISFENKSIKLSTLTNENTLFESILRITGLLKLDEKTDVSETSEVKKEEHLVQNNNAIHYPDINQSYLNAELELMEKGYRRAGKYECNSINEAKTANYIISQIFPYTEIVCRENNQADIYYSIFKKHLDEIIKSDNILSNTDIKRSGYLFGYPDCCTEEYLKSGFQYLPSFQYKWLIRRYKAGKEINPLFNPFLSNLYYFPCNLRCRHTLNRLKVMAKHIITEEKNRHLLLPIIFFLPDTLGASSTRGSAGNMEYILIEPISEKYNYIRYRALPATRQTSNTEVISKGNSLSLSEGVMTIFNNDKIIHRFCLNACIWYYKKTYDAGFWKLFIRLLLNAIQYKPVTIRKFIEDNDFIKIKQTLNNKRTILKKYNLDFRNISSGLNEILIELNFKNRDNNTLTLSVQKSSYARNFFIRGKNYSISIKEKKCNDNLIYPVSVLLLNLIENET